MKKIQVAANKRRIEYEDGTPFFYLGDTAWELFHRLNIEETERYLINRKNKGFTVIQAVVLAELSGLDKPNANGDVPLIDNNPGNPNEAYFEHIDNVIAIAEKHGLIIGMLPTWGRYWTDRPATNAVITSKNGEIYGRFLGERYRDAPIIWILGGDQNIENDPEMRAIEALVKGLSDGDDGNHLMTFHPRGPGYSSQTLHTAEWLDFNMIQSSHGSFDHDNGIMIEHDLSLSPKKPAIDGEPRYETIPVGFYNEGRRADIRFTDYDVRQAAYWAILAGACGHTYGNNNIWQMWRQDLEPVISAVTPWHEAIDHPGAFQMGYLRRLFESRPWDLLVPNQSFVLDAPAFGGEKVRAAHSSDGSYAFVYTPKGNRFTVQMNVIKGAERPTRVKASWFDPRYCITTQIHVGDNSGIQTFDPPTSGRGCDWILVLDDAEKDFPNP